jgi:hypothetical protein
MHLYMKKTLVLALILGSFAITSTAAHAEIALFNLKSSNKATITAPTPTPQAPAASATTAATTSASADLTNDDFAIEDLKNQSLPARRKLVSAQLGDILLTLNVLADKTKAAAHRLEQNGVVTSSAQTSLSNATLTLANAKLSIDALVTAANDPKNEAAESVLIDGVSFKDTVIKTEELLRTARQSIIDSLVSLKASLSTTATVSAN